VRTKASDLPIGLGLRGRTTHDPASIRSRSCLPGVGGPIFGTARETSVPLAAICRPF